MWEPGSSSPSVSPLKIHADTHQKGPSTQQYLPSPTPHSLLHFTAVIPALSTFLRPSPLSPFLCILSSFLLLCGNGDSSSSIHLPFSFIRVLYQHFLFNSNVTLVSTCFYYFIVRRLVPLSMLLFLSQHTSETVPPITVILLYISYSLLFYSLLSSQMPSSHLSFPNTYLES